MTHTIPDHDSQILDAIAIVMGTNAEWNADTLEHIANIVGTARPHPGDQFPDEYPLLLALRQDRRGPDSTADLCREHHYTAREGVTFQALDVHPFTDVTSWHAVQYDGRFVGYVGSRADDPDGEGMFLAGREPGAMTPVGAFADAVDLLVAA
ncbi:MAG: hypothetical protein L0H59_07265 [Tomitella sp.]|nr:hypothetical protein [Tomitella sp.]